MKAFGTILAEIRDLFVDDEFLAVGVLIVIVAAVLLAFLFTLEGAAGIVLFIGCPAVLLVSLFNAARKSRS